MSKIKEKIEGLKIPKENLCNYCPMSIRGKCCYFLVRIIDDKYNDIFVTLSNHPCKYLNIKTGRCKVYKKRHELNPNCLTIKEMIISGTIPKQCLYVKDNQEYQKRLNTALLSLPSNVSEGTKKKYEKINNYPHSEVASYDTLRTFLCPKCGSPNLDECNEEKFSFLFFSYKCKNCGYRWSNFQKQVNHSLKKLKGVNKS